MNKKPIRVSKSNKNGYKTVALAVALVCGMPMPNSLAQTGVQKAAPEERNLQVKAVAQPSVDNSQRVALIIGNGAYKEGPLTNPVNDAKAIAAVLRDSGFTVMTRENIDQRGMLAALREFGDKLRAGGTGLFYYAGHGMQIKGRNYLIPVGASIDREDEVAYSAVDAQAVLDKMEAAGNVANIMILDACRNNPFTRSTRSGQAGLAQMDAPVGTLVAYATSPGAVASDGSGANGLYTQHLLTAIREPSSKIEDVFKQVRANVRRDSQGKQVPWESTSLEGDFYFRGGPLAASAQNTVADVEAALWDAVKDSVLPIELKAYLNRYPIGKYATEAVAKLDKLQKASTEVVAATKPAPQAAPAPTVKPSAAAAKNTIRVAYSVGDSWTYTQDNLLTHKQSTFMQKVSSVSAAGDAAINDGALVYAASGLVKYVRMADRERFFGPGALIVPSDLRAGFKEPVNFELTTKFKDGRETKFVAKGTLEAVRREKIITPAGVFMGWRIQRVMQGGTDGAPEYSSSHTFWFVPEAKRIVAQEIMEINLATGKPSIHERTVLQGVGLVDSKTADELTVNMKSAAAQTGGADFSAIVDQATLDKRTAELLASVGNKPGAAQSDAKVPAKPARPAAASNKAGFTVGDRWRYQMVDKWKNEVVNNYSRQVSGFSGDGSIKLDGGAVEWTPEGALKMMRFSNGYLREFSPAEKLLPSTLQVGFSEPVKHRLVWREADGRNGNEERDGTLKVLAREKVKVPAGEFEAWKVEFSGFATGINLSTSASYVSRFVNTLWYVPALRNYVVNDLEWRDQRGQLQFFERHELTSFSVRGAENLAQR